MNVYNQKRLAVASQDRIPPPERQNAFSVSIWESLMSTNMTRRTFTKAATVAGIGAAALQTGKAKARPIGANDRIRCGFIGIANRGGQLIRAFAEHDDMEVAALCDVNSETLASVSAQFDNKPLATGDFRKLIERDDLDAIVIATPDHWHAIQTIQACASGKDVYVEKPMSITIHEGRRMVEAARKYQRVVQVGTHRRSSPLYRELAEIGADAKIGPVTVGRAYRLSNMWPSGIGRLDPTAPPANLDWDMWLGPRPERPYQENIPPYKFRWWQQYSSQMGNWGVHYLDAIRWLTGELAPSSVCAMGGRFVVDDDRTVPDTMEACFQFKSGRLALFGQYEANGNPAMATDENYRSLGEVELRGAKGTMYVSEKRYLVKPERGGQFQSSEPRMEEETGSVGDSNHTVTSNHARNFLDCMRTREKPNADVEIGHRSTSMSLMANISLAVGARLEWDAEAERFIGNDEANALLHYEYRKPWTLDV